MAVPVVHSQRKDEPRDALLLVAQGHLCHERRGLLHVRVGEDDDELVATVPHPEVAQKEDVLSMLVVSRREAFGVEEALQGRAEALQNLVAHLMPVGIGERQVREISPDERGVHRGDFRWRQVLDRESSHEFSRHGRVHEAADERGQVRPELVAAEQPSETVAPPPLDLGVFPLQVSVEALDLFFFCEDSVLEFSNARVSFEQGRR